MSLIRDDLLKELGVLDWSYTEEDVPRTLANYEEWCDRDAFGPLGYLADERRAQRRSLKEAYPEFQSALVFLFSYQEAKKWLHENNHHHIAGYSLGFEGEDYHNNLKRKLEKIFATLKDQDPELEHYVSLDAEPILERDMAYRSGLGWFGKNSMLIHRTEGSYFLIGSLLLNKKLSLTSKGIIPDSCGVCRACVDACPTNAIDVNTRTIIASQCISTFTIETTREAEPPSGFEKSRGEIFGCDICQDVCPWNSKPLSRVRANLYLQARFEFLKTWLFEYPRNSLIALIDAYTNRSFKKKLARTPFGRPGRIGWMKNLRAKATSRHIDSSETHTDEP